MKNYILMIACLLICTCFNAFSQTDIYPKIINDSGNSFVIMTIDQARKLDRDADLLRYYKMLHRSSSSLINKYDSVVHDYETTNSQMQERMRALEAANNQYSTLVTSKDKEISALKTDISLADSQLVKKSQIVKDDQKTIRTQKTLKWVGIIVGIAGVVVALLR